jgi:hypothetical protein
MAMARGDRVVNVVAGIGDAGPVLIIIDLVSLPGSPIPATTLRARPTKSLDLCTR